MSYNGIGLKTARGSGTSGHIQKSSASVNRELIGAYERRRRNEEQETKANARFAVENVSDRKVDSSILDHEQKREIEIQCLELQDELEEEGLDEEAIEEKVDALRKRLTQQNYNTNQKSFKSHEVHKMAVRKEQENLRMKKAFNSNKRGWRREGAWDNKRRDYHDLDNSSNSRDPRRDRDRSGSRDHRRNRSRSMSKEPRRDRSVSPDNRHRTRERARPRERSRSVSKSRSPPRRPMSRSPSPSRSNIKTEEPSPRIKTEEPSPRIKTEEPSPRIKAEPISPRNDPRSRRKLKAYE